MSKSVRINTTQNVRLDYEIASLGDRIVAQIIDEAVMIAYWFGYAYLMSKRVFGHSVALEVIVGLLPLLYHLLFEMFNNGQSLGKMIMKTRVIREDGTEPRIGDYIIRWLIGLFEVVGTNGGVALIAYLVGGKGQRLGDMAAGTTVAKIKQRVTLEETIYEETAPDYNLTYANADLLNDRDIETIKEVIIEHRRNYNVETILLAEKAKMMVEKLLETKAPDADSVAFLQTVVKDYNYITGKEF